MSLYVIGDLHLSLTGEKPMDVFGEKWANHVERTREAFSQLTDDDVVVLAGDSSWGMSLDGALADFAFLDALPGKKLLLKGNHDYWWTTATKMKRFFAEHGFTKLDILHNNCFFYGDHALCGTRGWSCDAAEGDEHDRKILRRELIRLEASLKAAGEREKQVFLHYPPKLLGCECGELLQLLCAYGVRDCWYGHLHSAGCAQAFEGEAGGIRFHLISADHLYFIPKKIF